MGRFFGPVSHHRTSVQNGERMSTTHPTTERSTETDDRIERALTQLMAVDRLSAGVYRVRTGSGGEYVVNVAENRCTCPDFELRRAYCKHLFRVAFETGAGIPGQCSECAGLTGLPCAECYIEGFDRGRDE